MSAQRSERENGKRRRLGPARGPRDSVSLGVTAGTSEAGTYAPRVSEVENRSDNSSRVKVLSSAEP